MRKIRPLNIMTILALTTCVTLFILSQPTPVLAQSPNFETFQSIPTQGANGDWAYFTIDNQHYLAVANHYNGSTYTLNSKIYRWNGDNFTEFQTIPTNGANGWKYFNINGEHYLAVANGRNDSTYDIDSKLYRWDGSKFVEFQAIATSGAGNWEYFTIGDDHFLAVTNHYNGSHALNSKIYRWNGSSFVEFQAIPTTGAGKWEYFSIGGDHYLAVTNFFDFNSKIYRWNGDTFVEFQAISTSSALDWEYFSIDDDHYLAVANRSNSTGYNIDSNIYIWNNDNNNFVEFQAIATNGGQDWQYFTFGGDHYLAVANWFNDSSHNIDSKIYRWNGSNFVEAQAIPTHGAWDWVYFTLDDEPYLAVANSYNGSTYNLDSVIYKAPTPHLTITKTGPTTVVAGEPITYTLTITNSGGLTATNLVISDTLPPGANYVSGGSLPGPMVEWSKESLLPDESYDVQVVVTATETITNSDYGVVAEGSYIAIGTNSVVTVIEPVPTPPPPYDVYLPIIMIK